MKIRHIIEIAQRFQIENDIISIEPYGKGHINDTYLITCDNNIHYILQRINHNVFKNPLLVMDNIYRVTKHQKKKLREQGCADLNRRALNLIPSKTGLPYYQNSENNTWRIYNFIEKATPYDFIESPALAFEAAKSFGEFQKQLIDLPGGRLNETIKDFHNTPERFKILERAINNDTLNRAVSAKKEINFVIKHKEIASVLIEKHKEGLIPERITHNDTKINNVMLDDNNKKGVCIIDLDTVMPGLTLYDFGDMIRTATSFSEEDEKNLSKVKMQMTMFKALVKGFLHSTSDFLTIEEKKHLAFCGKLITFEIGIRFLTDFIEGDTYFKVHREGQNLDRCRTQFKLIESIIEQEDDMNKFIESIL